MIQSIKVTNYKNESLTFELKSPSTSGFFIKGIDGLGPPKANINTTELLNLDGAMLNSARATSRNLVINLGFWNYPIETIEEIRLKSYKYFPLKQPLTIEITTDTRQATIVGYVETNDPDIFSSKESTIISIICPFPFWQDVDALEGIFVKMDPQFEFPFSNESVTEKLLLMSTVLAETSSILSYLGDAESGIEIFIHFTGSSGDLQIFNATLYQQMEISTTLVSAITGSAIQAGDDIYINTKRGEKEITLSRGGSQYNVFGALTAASKWITVQPGNNEFGFTADAGEQYVAMELLAPVLYEGI